MHAFIMLFFFNNQECILSNKDNKNAFQFVCRYLKQ
jgi:hypothetical protein